MGISTTYNKVSFRNKMYNNLWDGLGEVLLENSWLVDWILLNWLEFDLLTFSGYFSLFFIWLSWILFGRCC